MASPRRMLVAGNWKMNPPTEPEAAGLLTDLLAAIRLAEGVDVVICPPTIWLEPIGRLLQGSGIGLGAQTMHWSEQGAYTGETSPAMLAGLASHVILGHSERRQYDGETDDGVARKVASAVEYGLHPIAAVGERLEERQAGAEAEVIDRQLRAALSRLEGVEEPRLAIAYEPVWAIGTGMAASPDDAQAAAAQIRAVLRERFGDGARSVPILYGGSVTADNAAAFFAERDVDGALVGGASLKVDQFAAIVRAAAAAHATR